MDFKEKQRAEAAAKEADKPSPTPPPILSPKEESKAMPVEDSLQNIKEEQNEEDEPLFLK